MPLLEPVRVEDSNIMFGNEVVLCSTLGIEDDVAFDKCRYIYIYPQPLKISQRIFPQGQIIVY